MKLNKTTKHDLKRGDKLRFSETDEYTVLSVFTATDRYGNPNSVSITAQDQHGRVLYYSPSSLFYGAEIIRS